MESPSKDTLPYLDGQGGSLEEVGGTQLGTWLGKVTGVSGPPEGTHQTEAKRPRVSLCSRTDFILCVPEQLCSQQAESPSRKSACTFLHGYMPLHGRHTFRPSTLCGSFPLPASDLHSPLQRGALRATPSQSSLYVDLASGLPLPLV